MQIMCLQVEFVPIEIFCALAPFFHDAVEVIVNYFLFGLMLGDPTLLMFDSMNVFFFLLLALIQRWKNFVLASPSLRLEILAHCFLRALSSTAKLMTLLFSLARRSYSSGESCWFSCWFSWAMSRRRMTNRAA